MDEVSVKIKVTSLLAFLLVIMLLIMALPAASAPAPTLMNNNNNNGTPFRCNNGFMEEEEEEEEGEESCRLIANDYLDMEFMMGSGFSRMLGVVQSHPAQRALMPNRAACGRGKPGKPYTPGCSPQGRKKKPPPPRGCSPYYRVAPCN